MPFYTGIGSRETPEDIGILMTKIGRILATKGYTLRSGGADGADSFFEVGCDNGSGHKEIYLPWKGFNDNDSILYKIKQDAYNLAETLHPIWFKLKQSHKDFHARNTYQVLGYNLNIPSNFVIFYAKEDSNGNVSGGTATAVKLARRKNIPCYNLYFENIKNSIVKTLSS